MKEYLKVPLMIAVTVLSLQLVDFSRLDAQALSGEEYHRRTLEALKKMNHRLVRIENDKLESVHYVQESLLSQIMTLRTSIEQIQATGEINKSEMLTSVEELKTKTLDVEAHLRNEVMAEFDKQKQEDKRFRVQVSSLFGQLKNSLATDMESFSKANEQNFTFFSETIKNKIPKLQGVDKEILQEVISQINAQNDRLEDTNSIFKSDLIPAIEEKLQSTTSVLDASKIQSDLSSEKMSRLIDILKAVVVEQGKLDQILQGQEKQGLESVTSHKTVSHMQEEIKGALTDLRRKANVNISRNDDILKKIKKRG